MRIMALMYQGIRTVNYSYLINEHFVCSIFHYLQITLNQGRDLYFMNNKDQERYLFAFWRNKLPD